MNFHTRRDFLAKVAAVFSAAVVFPKITGRANASENAAVIHEVAIKKFKFAPDHLSVKPGDTIVWTNFDIAPHTATANDESWDTGTLKKDESHSMLVTENIHPKYFCLFHPHMKAALHLT